MNSKLNLAADQIIKGRIYPALAQHQARPYTPAWRQFGEHWPFTTPLRLQEYCNQHGVELTLYTVDSAPADSWYPICIGFFDFTIDYIDLLPVNVKKRIVDGSLKILFYYHEGDNPAQIKNRLHRLCSQHDFPTGCFTFVSANTQCQKLDGFVWFADFELWYYQRNIEQPPVTIHTNQREKDFTVLVRTHKSWRAVVMADLHRSGLLDNSFWSYCESGDLQNDNPIEIDRLSQLRWSSEKFLKSAPYLADELTNEQRNNHSITVERFHSESYLNIVLESAMDVDQSGGSFLTEKTFKPIKHGQLFFIVGAAGSLQQLRDLGYRTFDQHLDNEYDFITDPTERWVALRQAIRTAKEQGLHQIYMSCLEDIRHNQQLFVSCKKPRLNKLLEAINEYR